MCSHIFLFSCRRVIYRYNIPTYRKQTMMIPERPDSSHHVLLPDQVFSRPKANLLAVVTQTPFGSEKEGQDDDGLKSQTMKKNRGRSIGTKEDFDDSDSCHMNAPLALPFDFSPTPYTVIIGKGKLIRENLGNKRLRVLSSIFLEKYSQANEKRTKTLVVNEIICSIRSAGGSFVRKDKDGRWYQATDQAVREKIGYVFRDLLCDNYRSSSKSKVAKRQKDQLGRASMKLERAMRMTYACSTGRPSSNFSFYVAHGGERSRSENVANKNGESSDIFRTFSYAPIPLWLFLYRPLDIRDEMKSLLQAGRKVLQRRWWFLVVWKATGLSVLH